MDKHLTVRVDAEELERAERIATRSSTTRSDVVRAALVHGLAMLEDRVRVDLDAVQAARAVVLGGGK